MAAIIGTALNVITGNQAYDQLGAAIHAAGPLDEKTRGLIKLALVLGAQKEGALHAHVRTLIELGDSADECRRIALLSVNTLGFPATMTGLTWISEVLG